MSYIFGDSWDCYAAVADAALGYWDSVTPSTATLVAGRFSGSQAINTTNAAFVSVKSSGVNDAVHHVSVAYRQTSALTGTTLGMYLQLTDNITNQCCIVFRSDGVVLLTSATPVGTTLATYAGAVSAANTWTQFEFEVVIHNTTGSFKARKNGSTTDDHSTTGINTRPGANAYANKLTLAFNGAINAIQFDDLLWRSDAASVPWVGDIRCYARMPASDASVQFARTPNTTAAWFSTSSSSAGGPIANQIFLLPITSPFSGMASAALASFGAAVTGHVNMALYDNSGLPGTGVLAQGSPGVLLAQGTPITNPGTGQQTFTFVSPTTVVRGVQYWVAIFADVTLVTAINGGVTVNGGKLNAAYSGGNFPASGAGTGTNVGVGCGYVGFLMAPSNASVVSETLQDGTTSYVYDSVAGHADFYTVAALPTAPASTVAVTTRAFVAKSDAGTRTGAVQMRSGASFVGTAWNPADLSAITLSGSSLTATATGAGGVRSLISKSSGKHYWEVLANTFSFSSATGIGAANASAVLASMGSSGTGAIFVYQNGQVWMGGSSPGFIGGGSVVAGSRVCIALDMDTFLIWFRQGAGGLWNNNGAGNPATGVGGFSVSSIFSGAIPAFAAFAGGPSGDGVTANFGSSAFTGTPPVGFAAGLGGVGATVASPTLALSTSFGWTWRTDTTDPAGGAWTAAAVSACTIGPAVVA